MHHLPPYLSWSFIALTFAAFLGAVALFRNAAPRGKTKNLTLILLLLCWLCVQAVLAKMGVYAPDPEALPPRIMVFGVAPVLLTIALLFITNQGRDWIDRLPLRGLHYVHLVRIPVELVLWGLYRNGVVPEAMTFQGRNWDILAGITAPLMIGWAFSRQGIHRRALVVWNIICLGLLVNIILHAALSTPSPFQQWGFDQPNIAILYFPFHWLPTFVAPLVLFCHLAALRQLSRTHTSHS